MSRTRSPQKQLPFATPGPTSLDFINRPNPVEPQKTRSEERHHPLHDPSHRLRPNSQVSSSGKKQDPLRHVLNPAPVNIPLEPPSSKRQRTGDHHVSGMQPPATLLDLPKLPLRKAAAKKPRLPPTLSGLHQPPPDARLLPSIVTEKPRDPVGTFIRPAAGVEVAEIRRANAADGDVQTSVQHLQSQSADERAQSSQPGTGNDAEVTLAATGVVSNIDKAAVDADADSTVEKPDFPKVKAKAKSKHTRGARRKWSEDETACLLKGVAKHGIGNWTKILRDADFSFDRRTALDLKDRFRVCCPDHYRQNHQSIDGNQDSSRQRQVVRHYPQRQMELSLNSSKLNQARDTAERYNSQGKKKRGVKPERKSAAELQQLGITEPFTEASHRQKQDFSKVEDESLLRGFMKYGKRWAEIRNDEALGLSHRPAPDLRDRFRSRFKSEYTGQKLENEGSRDDNASSDANNNLDGIRSPNANTTDTSYHPFVKINTPVTEFSSSSQSIPSLDTSTNMSASRSDYPNYHQPLSVFHFGDVFFGAPIDGDDADGTTPHDEPIVLDRQILDYARSCVIADRQHRQQPALTSTSISSAPHQSLHLPLPPSATVGSSSTPLPSLAAITAGAGMDENVGSGGGSVIASDHLELPSLMQFLGASESDSRMGVGHMSIMNLEELLS